MDVSPRIVLHWPIGLLLWTITMKRVPSLVSATHERLLLRWWWNRATVLIIVGPELFSKLVVTPKFVHHPWRPDSLDHRSLITA
jgi:hypothetical protein